MLLLTEKDMFLFASFALLMCCSNYESHTWGENVKKYIAQFEKLNVA